MICSYLSLIHICKIPFYFRGSVILHWVVLNTMSFEIQIFEAHSFGVQTFEVYRFEVQSFGFQSFEVQSVEIQSVSHQNPFFEYVKARLTIFDVAALRYVPSRKGPASRRSH
jgi:hypothetical protein